MRTGWTINTNLVNSCKKHLMDLKQMERSKTEPQNTKRPKMELSKEARMILLMTKVRQTHQEEIEENTNFLNMMKDTRNGIKRELKIMKGLAEPEVEEEEVVDATAETNDHMNIDIDPNRELIKRIKKMAKPRIDTGCTKLKVTKDKRYKHLHNTKGTQQQSKHNKNEITKTKVAKTGNFG